LSVRGADHRYGAIEQRPILALENLVLRLPFLPGHAVAFLEIAAGAEGAFAGAGQYDGAHIARRGNEPRPEIEQIAAHLRVERIADFRPIERHQQEMAVDRFRAQRAVVALHACAFRARTGAPPRISSV
jgi:hypothetical protein